MPEELAVDTHGTVGAGAVGAGQPNGPPAPSAGAADPAAGGTAPPTAGPDGGSVPGSAAETGAQVSPELKAALDRAAKYERENVVNQKQVRDREAEISRSRHEQNVLKEKFGANYMERIAALPERPAAPPPAQAAPQPAPTAAEWLNAANSRGMSAAQMDNWFSSSYQNLIGGFTEQRWNAETGEMQEVHVPANPHEARKMAETVDVIYRQMGVRPPWDGTYGLGLEPRAAATAQVPMDTSRFATREQVLEDVDSFDAWADDFGGDIEAIGGQKLGVDFFDKAVEVPAADGTMRKTSIKNALRKYCRPTTDNPSGVPVWTGLLMHWPGLVAERQEQVAIARARVAFGQPMPGGAPGGPPQDPEARKAMGDQLRRFGIADPTADGRFSAHRPKEQARIVRDYEGGRDRL